MLVGAVHGLAGSGALIYLANGGQRARFEHGTIEYRPGRGATVSLTSATPV